MKKIYFVRHSIRDTTIKNEAAPLSQKGQKLALGLVGFFENKSIDIVYSSPFARAIDTINPTAEKLNKPIQRLNDLKERHVGSWVADFNAYSKQQWLDFDYKLPGGESLHDVKKRIMPLLDTILEQDHQTLIVTGHGTSFSVLFNQITEGAFGYEDFLTMSMPDIFIAEFDDKNQLISFENISQQSQKKPRLKSKLTV